MVGGKAVLLVSTFARTIFRLTRFERVQFFNTVDDAWAYVRKVIADEDAQAASNPATAEPE